MSRKTLYQLYTEHTGKVSDKWSLYLTEYDRLFDSYRDKPVRLLEIGIQNGGSLEIWSKYFSNTAALIGCDIDPECAHLNYEDPRIGVIIGDANAPEVSERVFQRSPQFDLIIDDGSHLSSDIIKSFALYFPRVVEGGIFITEDLHCSYWSQFEGGLFDPYSSISFFKRLADVINHEHWGVPKARADILRGFSEKFGCELDAEALSQVHSVEFINSMCVIRKASSADNGLGRQVIAGSMELVVPGRRQLNGRQYQLEPLFDQSGNPWTARKTPPDEAIESTELAVANLKQSVHDKNDHISTIEHAKGEADTQIAGLRLLVAERDRQIANLSKAVDERDGHLLEIHNSASWRVTAPLRRIKATFLRSKLAKDQAKCKKIKFDAAWYLSQNEDVKQDGVNPYDHYVLFGKTEGRLPMPDPFVRRNIKRLQIVFSLLPTFLNHAGGTLPAIFKILKVLKRDGWSGLVKRILILQTKSRVLVYQDQQADIHYKNYIAAMEPKGEDLEAMAKMVERLNYRPKFSIAVPVYNVDAKWLTRFIESVRAQIYPYWELCIADDYSTLPHVRPLLESFAAKDGRIRLVFRDTNGHISAATNSALELATGDFMCLMDHDDEIAPNALYEFASLLNLDESIDMIYSDEDKLDMEGNRCEPFFKPDWSPETLEGCMYTAHFACYRMSLVEKIGGFRSDFNGAQDYDFVLRFTESAKKIAHIPKILYHWRAIPGSTAASMDAKDYVLDAAVRALTERARRASGGGEARLGLYSGSFDLRYKINDTPLVSIIIPSAGRMACVKGKDIDLLAQAVSSIYKSTTYQNFEIIVVDNNDLRSETLEALKIYGCRYVHFHGVFNIATKMNLGAREARGEYLLFMNDDIEVITPDWMECMLQLCQREGVGVVGAKLQYENESLQHVGVAFWNGLPDHIHRAFPGAYPGHFFSAVANRNYLAVTGAVLMTKRKLFEVVGGFDEQFTINYNDIDYCLKVFKEGFRTVFAAGARLFHYESVSREAVVAPEEIALFQQKWMDFVSYDPYCSIFFDNHPPVFALRNEWLTLPISNPAKSPVISHR